MKGLARIICQLGPINSSLQVFVFQVERCEGWVLQSAVHRYRSNTRQWVPFPGAIQVALGVLEKPCSRKKEIIKNRLPVRAGYLYLEPRSRLAD